MRGARPLSAVTLRLASACECRVLVREGTVTQLTGQQRLLLPLLRIFRDFARGVKPSHHKNKTKRNKNTGHVNSGWSPWRVKQRHHGSALTPPPLLSVFRPRTCCTCVGGCHVTACHGASLPSSALGDVT